jgi:hypothetical protein
MKYQILPIAISALSLVFFSCNKTSSPNPIPSTQDTIPKVYSLYLPQTHVKIVEMFGYDAQSQLASIRGYQYDSSNGTPFVDSFLVSLTGATSTQPPTAYSAVFHLAGDPPAGNTEQHMLLYDGQNRVTTDSMTAATTNTFVSIHFIYDAFGNTTIQWLFGNPQSAGSYMVSLIDTMYIQQETVLTDINYSEPTQTFNRLFSRSYSTHINPLYQSSLANSLGCLMNFNNMGDFRSKYLPTQFIDQENGSPTVTLNYLWTTDATGSVVSGVGTDSGTGSILEIYTFTY